MNRLATLEEFLKQDPDDKETRYAIALEYATQRRYPEAITKLQDLIEHDPMYVPAYQYLGGVYARLHRMEDALRAYERGIRVAQHVGDAHAELEMQEEIDEIIDGDM